ncbi:hypothetical protein CLU79DRAFT_725386 [Phycomyces nitens]|nr:hypothetical protein CLU79DRAFT_725386 [Phycomyces nitens]
MYETPEPPVPPAAAALAAACLQYKGPGTITRLGRHRYVKDDGDWNEDVLFRKPNGPKHYEPAPETALDNIDDYHQPQSSQNNVQADPRLALSTKRPTFADIKAEEEEWDISEFTTNPFTPNQPPEIQHPKPLDKKISAVLSNNDDDFFSGMDFRDSFLKPSLVQSTPRLTPKTFASTPSTSQKLPSPSVVSGRNRPIPSDNSVSNSSRSTAKSQATFRTPIASKSQGTSRNQSTGNSVNRNHSSRASPIESTQKPISSRSTESPREPPVWDRLSKSTRDTSTTTSRRQTPLNTSSRASPEPSKSSSSPWRTNGGGTSSSVDSRSTDSPPPNNSPLHASVGRVIPNRREAIRPKSSVPQSSQGQTFKKKMALSTKKRIDQRDGTELDHFDNLSEWGTGTFARVKPKIKPTLRARPLNDSTASKAVDTKDRDRPWRQNMKRKNVTSILPGDKPLIKEHNGMKYDPLSNKWNGNEGCLIPFDQSPETRRRPARIRNRNNAVKHNQIVGGMYFDNVATTWRKLPKSQASSLNNQNSQDKEESSEDEDPLGSIEDLREAPLGAVSSTPTASYFIGMTPQDIRNNASKTKPEFELSLDTQRLMFEEEREHREFMANWPLLKDDMSKTVYGNLAPSHCFLPCEQDP